MTACTSTDQQPTPSSTATCQNDLLGYRVSYPADWFVHEADSALNLGECEAFGPAPFEALAGVTGVRGQSARIYLGPCAGRETPPTFRQEVSIDGFPSYVEEFHQAGDGYYWYVVDLRPDIGSDVECRGPNAFVRTEIGWPGEYEANKAVVDLMAGSLDFSPYRR